MGASSARQSQRVPIDAAVRLTLNAQEPTRTLPARALDLSEGGMRVATDVVLSVGEPVSCSLELNEERAALRGQVRWSKSVLAGQVGAGLGIQWQGLSEEHSRLLKRWLAELSPHAELVLLHLPNLREPLRARGSVNSDGLHLLAAWPQLAPGAELEFQLGDTGSRRIGRIERVEPHRRGGQAGFELSLQVLPMPVARSRRNLVYGVDDSEEARLQASLPAPAAQDCRPRRTTQQHGSPAQGEGALVARDGETADGAAADAARVQAERAAAFDRAALELAGEHTAISSGRPRGAPLARQPIAGESRPRARTSSQSTREARGRRVLGKTLRTERRTRHETLRVPTLNAARLRRGAIWLFAAVSIAALVWALQEGDAEPELTAWDPAGADEWRPPGAAGLEETASAPSAPTKPPPAAAVKPPPAAAVSALPSAAPAPAATPAAERPTVSPSPTAAPIAPAPALAGTPRAEAPPTPAKPEPASAAASPAATSVPAAKPAANPAPAANASAKPDKSPTPAVPARPLSAAGPAQPGLTVLGSRSEVFVPLSGKFHDMRATVWRDPPAVVIELPSARLDPKTSLQALHGGAVRKVRVVETHPARQLQIFLNVPITRFATRPLASGLWIVLEHDLRPLR